MDASESANQLSLVESDGNAVVEVGGVGGAVLISIVRRAGQPARGVSATVCGGPVGPPYKLRVESEVFRPGA